MLLRYTQALAVVLVSVSLALTGCGGPSSNQPGSSPASGSSASSSIDADAKALRDVKVTPGEPGKPPAVDFPTPLDVKALAVKLLRQGDGEQVQPGQQVTLRGVSLSAADGSQLSEDFSTKAGRSQLVDDSLKATFS